MQVVSKVDIWNSSLSNVLFYLTILHILILAGLAILLVLNRITSQWTFVHRHYIRVPQKAYINGHRCKYRNLIKKLMSVNGDTTEAPSFSEKWTTTSKHLYLKNAH